MFRGLQLYTFPRCKATEIGCKKVYTRFCLVGHRSNTFPNFTDQLQCIYLQVSTTKGTRWWVVARSLYITVFLSSANSATALASLVAWGIRHSKGARASNIPCERTTWFQGAMVTPSERLPSVLFSPYGSKVERACASVEHSWLCCLLAGVASETRSRP